MSRKRVPRLNTLLPVLALLLAGSCDRVREPYLGPPGTTETHVLVEVRRGVVTADVWRLRSTVTADGESSRQLLPEAPPSESVSFPATYKVLARNRTGQVAIMVEGLGRDGVTVGRASGVAELVDGRGVQLALDLGLACSQDLDCDDTVFCNGIETCVRGICAPGDRACPPSIHACVDISCSEETRQCLTTARDDLCGVPVRDGGSPEGFYCDVALGCLAGRPEAPRLVGEPEVSPSIGKLGTVFRVTFTVSEPLAADPVVRVDVGGRRIALLIDEGRTQRFEHRYGYTYTADGSEQQGRRVLDVDLVDLSGNAVTGLSAGGFTLDFTPPAVVGEPSLDNDVLMTGATSRLELTLSEPTAEPPEVRMGLLGTRPEDAASPWAWSDGGDLARHRFTYVALGTETEGAHLLWWHATDQAGNHRAWTRVGQVALDFTAPGVDGSATVLPPIATVGRTVVIDVPLTEPIVSSPTLTATDGSRVLAFSPGDNTGRRLSFYHVVEEGEDGVYPLLLEGLVDEAGNASLPVVVGSVTVDGTPPALASYSQNLGALTASDEFQVSFSANELLGTAPLVRLGPLEMERAGTSAAPYVFRLRMAGTTLVGTFPVTVEIADVVGNRHAMTAGSVLVDAVPPALLDAFFTPPVARLGITAYLSLTVSEMLREAPVLGWDRETGDPGFTFVTRSGVTYTYQMDVGPDASPGVYLLPNVGLVDVAGNPVDAHPSDLGLVLDFTVDNRPPHVGNLRANRTRYSAVGAFRDLVLTFDCSESVDVAPGVLAVTVAGFPLTCDPFQQTPPNYRCTRALTGEEPSGTALLGVVATDRAGNVGTGNAVVELDFGKPTLASSTASPSWARLGDTVVYVVTPRETLARTPVLHVTGPGNVTLEHRDGTSYIFSHAVTDPSADGEHAVTIDLEDTVGNVSTGLVGAGFKIDGAPPVVSAVAADRARYSAIPGFRTVTLTFNVDDARSAVSALLGLTPMACGPHQPTPPNRTCAVDIVGSEGDDRVEMITVVATDEAGNTGRGSATVSLDFTPPALVASSARPAVAKLNDEVVYSVTPGEALARAPVLHVGGAGNFVLLHREETTYVFTGRVEDATADGDHAVTIDMEDTVGNVSTGRAGALFHVDGTPPVVSAVATDRSRYSAQPGYRTITLTFNVDDVLSTVSASLGLVPMNCGPHQDEPPHRTCTVDVVGDEGDDRVENISVRATDTAENRGQGSATVSLDFTPPGVVPGTAELQLTPPAGCPLPTVTRWTVGGTARVLFVVDEPVGEIPTVATRAPAMIAFAHRSGAITSFSFEWFLDDETLPQGRYTVEATVSDLVGNTRTHQLALATPLVVDTVAPTLLVDQDAVRFVRSPWGNAAAEDLGGFVIPAGPLFELAPAEPLSPSARLPAATFSLDEGAPALLRVWADDARSLLLGSMRPGGDGSWERLQLAAFDTPVAHVSALDQACNTSQPVRIENAEWVATPRPAVSGPSPHALRSTARHSPALLPLPGTRVPAGWGADGSAALERASPTWEEAARTSDAPMARRYHAMVYDSARGRTIVYGGEGLANGRWTNFNDTWQWDGRRWLASTPADGSSPARREHAMVYDSARGLVLLFGGFGPIDGSWNYLQDTWTWDGFAWTDVTPASGSPPALQDHAMAYDSARGRAVVFGGLADGYRDGTWEWDGSNWADVSPPSGRPGRRYKHAMAYDSIRGRVVLFGGVGMQAGSWTLPDDTWEWDGSTWTDVTPASARPPGRNQVAMAFDSARGRVVLFGGYGYPGGVGTRLRDTWEWDGSRWHNVTPAAGSPPATDAHAMAFDSARGRVVLFSGEGFSQDTWEWDGLRWHKVTPSSQSPSSYYVREMAYDSARHKIVLFGSDDLWEVDGAGWTKVTPTTGSPPSRPYDTVVAYDSARGRLVLFGGVVDPYVEFLRDTWEWDGRAWHDVTPADNNPPGRIYAALAYDAGRGRAVLFGGYDSAWVPMQDTWEWDGNSWTWGNSSGPNPRANHAMSYDALRGRLVLFGGYDGSAYDDTWEWDGGSWTDVTPAEGNPPGRYNHAMAYDSTAGRVMVFGGMDSGSRTLQDTWAWDGASWTDVTHLAKGIPPPQQRHRMAYDPARNKIVLFGDDGTWEYDNGNFTAPAFQFQGDLGQAGFDPASVLGLRVRAHCGGAFAPYEAGDVGASLYGWATGGPALPPGSWLPLAANSASASTVAPYLPPPPSALIDRSTNSSEEAQRLFFQRTLNFQCRPSGLAGNGSAPVALDYFEVRVRYQAP
jgi:hypothetical protein